MRLFLLEKLFLLKFWMRQLPTNSISICNTFASFEKCMVCSAKAGLVPGDLSTLTLLAVTSNYHKHPGDHNFPQRTLFTLTLEYFRVLRYASCFACICILPSAEQFSYCIMIPCKHCTLNCAWELDILTSAWWLCVCSRFHLNKKPGGPLSYSDYDYLSGFVYYSLSKPGMFVLVLFESL